MTSDPSAVIRQRLSELDAEQRSFVLDTARRRLLNARAPIPPRKHADHFPLSLPQRRLWYLYQLNPLSTMYNMPECVRMRGPLDVNLFQAAFDDVVARHESLRATFTNEIDGPIQMVSERIDSRIQIVDIEHLPEEEREERGRALLFDIADRPFDLRKGPVIRLSLVRLDREHHFFVVNMHHIVSDGWSMGIFARDFSEFMRARRYGQMPRLAPLPVRFGDFVEWHIARQTGSTLDAQLDYWRPRLDGVTDLALPFDRPPSAETTERGGFEYIVFPPQLAAQINACAKACGITLFMFLLAAFCVLLHRYSLQTRITVGTPAAGRVRAETENLIGFFANTLLISIDVQPESSFRHVAQLVREASLGAFSHNETPFEKLVEVFQPDRNSVRNPLFQVMFILQNTKKPMLSIPDISLELFAAGSMSVKFDMLLECYETSEGITGYLGYRRDLFNESTAQCFARNYHSLVTGVVTDPHLPIADLSIDIPAAPPAFNDDLSSEF